MCKRFSLVILIAGCLWHQAFAADEMFVYEATQFNLSGKCITLSASSENPGFISGIFSGGAEANPAEFSVIQFRVADGQLVQNKRIQLSELENEVLLWFLTDDKALSFDSSRQTAGEAGKDTYRVLDLNTGERIDVTPDFLPKSARKSCCGASVVYWSEEQGLAAFVVDEDNLLHLWQGHQQLEDVQQIPGVIANGRGPVSGLMRPSVLTSDGEIWVYCKELGEMVHSAALDCLAQQIEPMIPRDGNILPSFRFAAGFAIFKYKGGYQLVSAEGKQDTVRRLQSRSSDLYDDSLNLTEEEKEAMRRDTELLCTPGNQAPADVAGVLSGIVPVDESHVGIIDFHFNRFVLIGLDD